MRKVHFLFFVITVWLNPMFGQTNADSINARKPMIGFNIGILGFKSIINTESNSNQSSFQNYNEIEQRIRPGFSAGCFVSLVNAEHFSFQQEINYVYNNQNVKYSSFVQTHLASTKVLADYTLDISSINVLLMPKFTFGKKIKYYFGLGNFFLSPIGYNIEGQIGNYSRYIILHHINDSTIIPEVGTSYKIVEDRDIDTELYSSFGLFFCSGFFIPNEKNNFGIEFRVYYSKFGQGEGYNSPYVFGTLNLTYQITPKGNYP